MILRCALLLAMLVAAGVYVASADEADASMPRAVLPTDMQQWNVVPGFAHLKRFWDTADLEPAFQSMGNPLHTALLLAKLNAGRPVTAVAIGSSFVANQAGCFHTSLQQLYNRGVLPNPHIYPLPGADPTRFGGNPFGSYCDSGGYMESLMATINATWPHPDHMAFNHGAGGLGLENFMTATCIDAYVPQEVDVVLLDTATVLTTQVAIEYWIRKFLALPSHPLVLLVTNTGVCRPANFDSLATPKMANVDWSQVCVTHCLSLQDDAWCEKLGTEPFPKAAGARLENTLNTHGIQSLANHYGVPHISLHPLVAGSFLDVIAPRVGITKYQMLSRLYMDGTHFQECHAQRDFLENKARVEAETKPKLINPGSFPCVNRTGQLVVADLLVGYLVQMQASLHRMTKSERHAMHYELPAPVHQAAETVYRSRCYGVSFEQAAALAPEGDARAGVKTMTPGDGYHLGEVGDREANKPNRWNEGPSLSFQQNFEPLPALNVTRLQGFKLVTHYTSAKGQLRFKPGYVASGDAGALMEIEVDTSFPGTPADAMPEVRLSYTTSYDGWGKARISCVSGCTCQPDVIDASTEERSSLVVVHHLPASQAARCAVRIEVLDETSSGGRKFKVATVAVKLGVRREKSAVDATAVKQAVA
ncbi:hypothetical protein FOA52_010390 [Chlamydomonas sp. UWO 241]|nr:hypothetical protein FOA52_010390 [Chlamydomonas sp. UWO 241]